MEIYNDEPECIECDKIQDSNGNIVCRLCGKEFDEF